MLAIRNDRTIPVLDGGLYTAKVHLGVDALSDLPVPRFRDVVTYADVVLAPSSRVTCFHAGSITEIVTVLEGRLEIFQGGLTPRVVTSGSVHAVMAGKSFSIQYLNLSSRTPVRFIRLCLSDSNRPNPSATGSVASSRGTAATLRPLMLPFAPYDPAFDLAGHDGSTPLAGGVELYFGDVPPGRAITHQFRRENGGYVILTQGTAHIATETDAAEVRASAGVAIVYEAEVTIRAREEGAQLLLLATAVNEEETQ